MSKSGNNSSGGGGTIKFLLVAGGIVVAIIFLSSYGFAQGGGSLAFFSNIVESEGDNNVITNTTGFWNDVDVTADYTGEEDDVEPEPTRNDGLSSLFGCFLALIVGGIVYVAVTNWDSVGGVL